MYYPRLRHSSAISMLPAGGLRLRLLRICRAMRRACRVRLLEPSEAFGKAGALTRSLKVGSRRSHTRQTSDTLLHATGREPES